MSCDDPYLTVSLPICTTLGSAKPNVDPNLTLGPMFDPTRFKPRHTWLFNNECLYISTPKPPSNALPPLFSVMKSHFSKEVYISAIFLHTSIYISHHLSHIQDGRRFR